MATQGERQDFMFPPNDNSSTTNLRYDLTAEKWLIAMRNAERKHKPLSFNPQLGVIGMVLQLIFALLMLLVLSLIQFVKWLRQS